MRRELYNIYVKAHRKLRRQLIDAGLVVQATDFGKKQKRIMLLTKSKKLIVQFINTWARRMKY